MSTRTSEGQRKQPNEQASSPNGVPPPRAWTSGTNPITQRSNTPSSSAGSMANGNGQSQRRSGPTISDKQAHDRLIFLLTYMTGLDVKLALKSGRTIQGVFSGIDQSQPRAATYTLKMAREDGGAAAEFIGVGVDHTYTVSVDEVVDLAASGVNFASSNARAANGFRTDVEISGNLDVRERVLQKWQPVAGDKTDMSLGIEESGNKSGWDQFKANEKLYNVRSDYNEDMYTTTINRSDPEYARKAEKAARLAAEIEGTAARKPAEADSGLDEEDKYSGVRRDTPTLNKGGPGAYVPPSKRAITSTPTVSGAPYDPAIISSQLARPSASTPKTDHAAVKGDSTSRPAPSAASPVGVNGASARSSTAKAAPQPSGKTATDKGQDFMRNVTDAFKQFNQSEKLRVQQQQRQQQQQRANSAKQEKSVKLNDLRKFSQNFKLHSRVPDDLVPILAKSKEKQDEIVARAEKEAREKETVVASPPSSKQADAGTARPAAAQAEVSKPPRPPQQKLPKIDKPVEIPPFSGRASSAATSRQQSQSRPQTTDPPAAIAPKPAATPSSVTASAHSPTPSMAGGPGLNVKAMAFKPNPSASTFTPGGVTGPSSKRPSIASPPPPSYAPSPHATEFFPSGSKKSKLAESSGEDILADSFSILDSLRAKAKSSTAPGKEKSASNGGVPPGYQTVPTWDAEPTNQNRSYTQMFPPSYQSRTMSPTHGSHNGAMPHQHQLPLHLQNGPGHGSPHLQRSHPYGHFDDKRMHFSPSQSMHPSPQMGQPGLAYPGQAQMMYPYANGVSPNMRMRPMPNGAQYMTPQGGPIGGHMMVPQGSNGPYLQQPVYMYSPGQHNAQPHYGAQHGQAGMPGGFTSPRGHPMSHQGSQQGHMQFGGVGQNGQMMMMPQHGGPAATGRGYNQGQFGGQQHGPHAMQHRTMSNSGYSSTPRQHHALPQSQSAAQIPQAGNTAGEEAR